MGPVRMTDDGLVQDLLSAVGFLVPLLERDQQNLQASRVRSPGAGPTAQPLRQDLSPARPFYHMIL